MLVKVDMLVVKVDMLVAEIDLNMVLVVLTLYSTKHFLRHLRHSISLSVVLVVVEYIVVEVDNQKVQVFPLPYFLL